MRPGRLDTVGSPPRRHRDYDEESKSRSFGAVLLIVYKANGGVCQQAALTMQPLQDNIH